MTDPKERLAYRTPAAEHLGREVLEVYPDTLEVLLRFCGRPEFTNRHGKLRGGILGAMLDSAMACTLMSAHAPDPLFVTTVQLGRAHHSAPRAPRRLSERGAHGGC